MKEEEKAAAKEAAAKEKVVETDKKVAKLALDVLTEPLSILVKTKDGASGIDEYAKESCELLLKRTRSMMESASATVISGVKLPYDMKAVRDIQSELSRTLTQ